MIELPGALTWVSHFAEKSFATYYACNQVYNFFDLPPLLLALGDRLEFWVAEIIGLHLMYLPHFLFDFRTQ